MIHVEIAVRPSNVANDEIEETVMEFINTFQSDLPIAKAITFSDYEFSTTQGIHDAVENFVICEPLAEVNTFVFFVYRVHENEAETEYIESEMNSNEEVEAGTHWILPCREFEGLYESLMFEVGVKERLLSLVETTIQFSRLNVNANLITNNRMALMWGPPGTGKTSLCKAVAQKLAIRTKKYFEYTHLIEINCHSLFSKWFSESGKLVQQMFGKIHELIENPKSLVIVLIDEVESIAYSRANVSNNEPTDSLRVVNAILTQLDRIRRFNNVLVLTTSNVPASIDDAFVDRADIVQYIGPPSPDAIQSIYTQGLHELRRVGILEKFDNLPDSRDEMNGAVMIDHAVTELVDLSRVSYGLSGRNIRKIPFLAHAALQQKENIKLLEFLNAMRAAAEKLCLEKKSLEGNNEVVEVPTAYLNEEAMQNLQIIDSNGYALVASDLE